MTLFKFPWLIVPGGIIVVFFSLNIVSAQQVADSSYNPVIKLPAYATGKGPTVFLDEGHHNFHTAPGRYLAFARLVERDGYIVKPHRGTFTAGALNGTRILVISNSLNEKNNEEWALPVPSAFTQAEIQVVRKWVENGGSLFLIADHMPFSGAAAEMAAAFGFEFTNGFVIHDSTKGMARFTLADHSLAVNNITSGRNKDEKVDTVITFTGQGFKIPEGAISLLTFDDHYTNLLPDTAWVFNESTRRQNAKGMSQGAVTTFGKGRVAVFGEAAMFSAQLAGPEKIKAGMNNEIASQNYRFLLNIVHWLDFKIDY